MAIRNQVMNAKTAESSNLTHGRWDGSLQNFKSLAYRTAIPAEEHAAASDNVDVTCTQISMGIMQ